jgi:glycosyltransferase involved in cell wall biosynthesis
VDPATWDDRPSLADAIRERYGPGPLVVLLGRLVHYKGAEVLVEAMKDVAATALIVGDGPRRAGAEALAAQLDIADRVVFTGAIDDEERSAYMHAAMATGTPSISTEIGTGTSWVNRHGETGLVVPANDPGALARAITELITDDARRAAMGTAAKRRVRGELTSEQMFDALRRVYEDAAAER